MNNCKRRTGNGGGAAQAGNEALDELGFAAAELAGERKHRTGGEVFRELPANFLRLRGAIGNERSQGKVDG